MESRVSIVSCKSYDKGKVYEAVKQAIKDIGFKIPKGKKVLVKPNILGGYKPEEAVTTHPAVVEAICKILKENKCKTFVGDSSGFSGSTRDALCASGIKDAAEKYGATVLSFESVKIIDRKIKGKILKEVALPKIIDEIDFVIDLPKLKTHSMMIYTAAVKNLFGFVPGGRKPDYHNKARKADDFANLLCDIYETLKPKIKLVIVDAIVGMEGNGPAAGKPKPTGLIIAGDDAGATDFMIQKIIKLESPLMACLIKRKLADTDNIKVKGKIPSIPYQGPSSLLSINKFPHWMQRFIEKQMIAHPEVDKDKCIKCGICAKSCPTKAITLKPYPRFNRRICIDCYCCHELCPEHAIYLKGSIGRKLLIMSMNIKTKVENRKSK